MTMGSGGVFGDPYRFMLPSDNIANFISPELMAAIQQQQLPQDYDFDPQSPQAPQTPARPPLPFGGQGSLATPLPGIGFQEIASPEVKGQKKPGFIGRIRQKPGGSEALLALGASLLSNPDFFSGLGQGALAYQQTLNEHSDKLKPKLSKDGTFSYRVDEDGNISWERTPIADFEEQMAERKLQYTEAIAKLRDDGQTRREQMGNESAERIAQLTNDYKYDELAQRGEWAAASDRARIDAATIRADAALEAARLRSGAGGKPPSSGILKQYDEHKSSESIAASTLSQGANIMRMLTDGTLDLGPIANVLNMAGTRGIFPTESSRAYGELQQFTQQLVNAILLDARGVQTDGDALRARIQTMVSSGDNEGAAREISNALRMIERGRKLSRQRADDIASQYGIKDSTVSRPNQTGGKPSVSNW